ncbi:substrate-binding domain-containing protein, partial [Desulfobacter sp.]
TPAETTPAETILRLHGSNTIGAKLAPALVKKYLTQKLDAKQITVKAGDHANESTILAFVDKRHIGIEIHAHGSSTGFKDLAAGKCDIAMASRQIKDKEIDKLAFLGDMTSISSEHVIGLDGIAVIVNKVNKINKLTTSEIKEAFNGSITDWGLLGGNSGSLINVYSRDDNSGTYDTFKSIVLGKKKPLINTAKRYESNPVLSDDVSKDKDGIGFTGLPYIRRAKALSVSDGAGQAILPTFFTVATEDYPISRRLYMYCSPIPDNPNVQPFIDFVHSEAGQKTVQEIGFVDMNIRSFHMPPPSAETVTNKTVLDRYLNAIKDAKRLSLNFRFKKAASELDNRSIRDLDRMVKFLTDKEERIILAGFADNSGSYNSNLQLAMGRAQKVASEMQSRGIIPSQVLSCSEELPVASNDSAKGRGKNRRVEVWIK